MLLHIDLFVKSIEKSIDFYSNKLGMEILDDTIVTGDLVKFVSKGIYDKYRMVFLKVSYSGCMIELIEFIDDELKEVDLKFGPTTFTILTNSINIKMKALSDIGIFPISEVYDVETPKLGKSRIVFYEDPDKNVIEFLQVRDI